MTAKRKETGETTSLPVSRIHEQSILHFPTKKECLWAILISLGIVLFFSWYVGTADKFQGDAYRYVMQAKNPLSVIAPPHGLRILTPRIVYFLPLNIRHGFLAVTILSMAGTVTLAYLLLRLIGCGIALSLALTAGFIMHNGFRQSLFHYAFVDALSFFLIELGILAIYLRKEKLFSSSLLFGVLNRETSIFLLPVYHFCRWKRWWSWKAISATLLLGSASIVVFFVTRFALFALSDAAYFTQIVNQYYGLDIQFERYDQFYLREFQRIITEPEKVKQLLSLSTLSANFGILAPLSLLGWIWGRKESRALVFYLLCIWIQILFAFMTSRLVFFAFPVFLLLSGEAAIRIQELHKPYRYSFLAALAIFNGFWTATIWMGVGLSMVLLLFLRLHNRPLLRVDSQTLSPHSEPPQNTLRWLRVGLHPLNVGIVLLVFLNLTLIYTSRPTLIGRMQEWLPKLKPVEVFNPHSGEAVYIGQAEINTVRSFDRKLYSYKTLPEKAPESYILIPARHPIFRNNKKIVTILFTYPTKPTQIFAGVTRPFEDGSGILLEDNVTGKRQNILEPQLNKFNKSLPFYLHFPTPKKDILFFRIRQGVLLIDVFFFECEQYIRFERYLHIDPSEV